MTSDEWGSLDGAARANLSDHSLVEFFRYKEDLRRNGHVWADDAHDILAGFIWDESADAQA